MTTINTASVSPASSTSTLKAKVVNFAVADTMRMPDMVKAGYQREEVTALFTELHAKGLGLYTPGARGKGKAATFSFLGDLPEGGVYQMTFMVEKLHTQYAGKPGGVADPAAAPVVLDAANKGTRTAESLTAARYTILRHGDALKVMMTDQGAPSIEGALVSIWGDIKEYVGAKPTRHMTALEQVASRLMGVGYYDLSEVAAAVPAPTGIVLTDIDANW
jgi:hypothetical protein